MNAYKQMREALEIAKKAICNHARANHTCDSLAWENSTINANCGDILCGHRDLCEAKTAIQKALAAPARNCDKFDDYISAKDYFLENELWKYNQNLTPEYWFGLWTLTTADEGGAE